MLSSAVPVAATVVVLAATLTTLALALAHAERSPSGPVKDPLHPGHGSATATTTSPLRDIAPCVAPRTGEVAGTSAETATRLGSWPFTLIARGSFEELTPSPSGALVAIQACGTEESSLRVVSLDRPSGVVSASQRFDGAASLASSLAVTSKAVFFGHGRLALDGSATRAPYLLTLSELDPATLGVERSVALGRGYGLELGPGPGNTILASTGDALYSVSANLRVKLLASFPGAVVQHMAVVASRDLALLSLFTPSAGESQSSTKLALFDIATARTSASRRLPAPEEVGALAVEGSLATVSVTGGGTTTLEHYRLSSLRPVPSPAGGVPASLSSLSVAAAGDELFVFGPDTLACVATSGAEMASTILPGRR